MPIQKGRTARDERFSKVEQGFYAVPTGMETERMSLEKNTFWPPQNASKTSYFSLGTPEVSGFSEDQEGDHAAQL
jgi:hypothetical protein